jgi:hypothetical protein
LQSELHRKLTTGNQIHDVTCGVFRFERPHL